MVIAAGVGGEPRGQQFLRNQVSVYVGNISYSLYLVHWPIIVILGSLLPNGRGLWYVVAVVTMSFGLAILSYHFVENPLRYADRRKFKRAVRRIKKRRFQMAQQTRQFGFAALILVTVGLLATMLNPGFHYQPVVGGAGNPAPKSGELVPTAPKTSQKIGPLTTALQRDISKAVGATEWPPLSPPLAQAVDGEIWPSEVNCDYPVQNPQSCTWGSGGPRAILVGDSIALGYAGPLRQMALEPRANFQLYNLAMGGCVFSDALVDRKGLNAGQCTARKQDAVNVINASKPDVVFIANRFRDEKAVGSSTPMTVGEWSDSLKSIVSKFQGSVKKIVFLSQPAGDMNIKECISKRSTTPADCLGTVGPGWLDIAAVEQQIASSVKGVWIDSRPWLCSATSSGDFCPSFVGTLPSKRDVTHMTPEYASKIYPVIEESLREAGVLPSGANPSGTNPPGTNPSGANPPGATGTPGQTPP